MTRALYLALAASLILAAQQTASGPQTSVLPSSSNRQPFRVQVNEVIVAVTVTDEKGRFVSNLDRSDFKVYEDGKEQQIQYFSREREQPVVIGFLVDISNASRLHWKTYLEAAEELVFTLLKGDPKYSGYLIAYGNEAELLVNTTTDSEKIISRLRKLKPGGGAALFDAIYKACTSRALVKGEPIEPRRILIIIGDGHDSASHKSLEEVLEIAQRQLVTIYGVSTTAFGFTSEGEKNLSRLAEETGGRVEYPLQNVYKDVSGYLETPSDEGNYALKVGTGGYASALAQGIFRAIANVVGEVTTQYIIRYVPAADAADKAFRSIRVEVPGLPGVKVRARKGYYPGSP